MFTAPLVQRKSPKIATTHSSQNKTLCADRQWATRGGQAVGVGQK